MAEYIEREAALQFHLKASVHREKVTAVQAVADAIAEYINAIPAADVVPVVRCGECKYRQDDDFCGGRGWPAQLVPDDGFCDKGKRKDGNRE